MPSDMPMTRTSLIRYLATAPIERPADAQERSRWNEAWSDFVTIYQPIIVGWCRRNGLSEHDALDLAQSLFCKLRSGIRTFDFHRQVRFRTWLRTAVAHHCRDLWRRQARERAHREDWDMERLNEWPAHAEGAVDELTAALQRPIAQQFHEALLQIERTTAPKNWQVFQRLKLHGWSAAEVGKQFGMSANAVCVAAHRVLAKLKAACHVED